MVLDGGKSRGVISIVVLSDAPPETGPYFQASGMIKGRNSLHS